MKRSSHVPFTIYSASCAAHDPTVPASAELLQRVLQRQLNGMETERSLGQIAEGR
jgi:hypothetical protein